MPLLSLHKYGVRIDPKFAGPFTRPLQYLYGALSTIPLPQSVGAPAGLGPLLDLVYRGEPYRHIPTDDVVLPPPVDCADDRVLVGYSGGKDSMAAVVWCLTHGMTPTIFHVTGVNCSYPNEAAAVRQAAARLCVPLVTPAATRCGSTAYPDSPVKDQLILAMMADYGYTTGCRRFTMGVQSSTTLTHSNILYNWSDNWEMFAAVRPWFQAAWPAYSWAWVLESKSHSYRIIVDYDATLLEAVCSCVLPYRYQAARKRGNEAKYGVVLMPNRCGSCQKCAVEYINLVALGVVPYNDGFVEHSLQILERKQVEIFGPDYRVGERREDIVGIAIDPKWADPSKFL